MDEKINQVCEISKFACSSFLLRGPPYVGAMSHGTGSWSHWQGSWGELWQRVMGPMGLVGWFWHRVMEPMAGLMGWFWQRF